MWGQRKCGDEAISFLREKGVVPKSKGKPRSSAPKRAPTSSTTIDSDAAEMAKKKEQSGVSVSANKKASNKRTTKNIGSAPISKASTAKAGSKKEAHNSRSDASVASSSSTATSLTLSSSSSAGAARRGSTAAREKEALATIEQMKKGIEQAEHRQDDLRQKMDNLLEEARFKKGRGDQRGAINCMKKRKFYEAEHEKVEQVKFTIETQIMSIESSLHNAELFGAMLAGSHQMKLLNAGSNVDQIDETMDDVQESLDLGAEINASLSQQVVANTFQMDDDDLLAELQALDSNKEDELMDMLNAAPTVPNSRLESNVDARVRRPAPGW